MPLLLARRRHRPLQMESTGPSTPELQRMDRVNAFLVRPGRCTIEPVLPQMGPIGPAWREAARQSIRCIAQFGQLETEEQICERIGHVEQDDRCIAIHSSHVPRKRSCGMRDAEDAVVDQRLSRSSDATCEPRRLPCGEVVEREIDEQTWSTC